MAPPHSRLGDQLASEVGVAEAVAIKVSAIAPTPLHVNPANKGEGEAESRCNVISNLRKTGSMFEFGHFGKLRKWAGSGQLVRYLFQSKSNLIQPAYLPCPHQEL